MRSFTCSEKLKVIKDAEENGNRASARKFDVSESCIRDWRKKKELLLNSSANRRAFRGQKAKFPVVEAKLTDYILEKRELGYAVSTEMCRLKVLVIAREENIKDFKASRGWIVRMFERNNLSVRRRTSVCQKLPSAYEDKLVQFQRYVIRMRHQNNYLMSQIGNADQTPVYFEMPYDTTVHKKGEKQVTIRTGGNEKQRCTVMLSITADGRKLPPYVVFKRKTLPKIPGNGTHGVIVQVQEAGWMNTTLIEDWIKRVWMRRPGALLKKKCLLVLDSFRGHTTEEVKKILKKGNTDLAIIPGGLTSVLQPLHVCINRPFKAALKEMYTKWMAEDDHAYTPVGKIKRPDFGLICKWISDAWTRISPSLVEKSFKKCSISNQLDGTEDDCLWNSESDNENSGDDGDEDDDCQDE